MNDTATGFSPEELYLIAALRAALHGTDAPHPHQINLAQVLQLAERHKVAPLLADAYAGPDVPADLRARAETLARQNAHQLWRLLFATNSCVEALATAGIDCVVLKGVGVAGLWRVPELRKSGDIDLLPLQQSDFCAAERVLLSLDFTPDEDQHANHQVVLRRGSLELELHRALVEDFDNAATNDFFAAELLRVPQLVDTQNVLGLNIPVLKPAHQAFHLLSHMLQDFLRNGFGLRLLCDWVYLWERPGAEEFCDEYLELASSIGVMGFSRTVTRACQDFLGLSSPAANRLAAGSDAAGAAGLLREVLDAGEFGRSSDSRMVMTRGSSPVDLAREFHHQTKLNFPQASKLPLAWPALWTATLARFVRNNHTVRNTSVRAVVSTAIQRSRLHKDLGIFSSFDAGPKADVESLLAQGHTVRLTPSGWSMYPLLRPHKDSVVLEPTNAPVLGDVLLFRRTVDPATGKAEVGESGKGKLVLHRLVRIGERGYYFMGDNQLSEEGPIGREAILARLVGFTRGGRQHTTNEPVLRAYAWVMTHTIPLRGSVHALARAVKSLARGKA